MCGCPLIDWPSRYHHQIAYSPPLLPSIARPSDHHKYCYRISIHLTSRTGQTVHMQWPRVDVVFLIKSDIHTGSPNLTHCNFMEVGTMHQRILVLRAYISTYTCEEARAIDLKICYALQSCLSTRPRPSVCIA